MVDGYLKKTCACSDIKKMSDVLNRHSHDAW